MAIKRGRRGGNAQAVKIVVTGPFSAGKTTLRARHRAEADSLRHWPPSVVVVVLMTWTAGCLPLVLRTCARVPRWRIGLHAIPVLSTWPLR